MKKFFLRGFVKDITIAFLIAAIIRSFFIELYYVPSESLMPTLLKKEYIFATKYDYGYSKYSFWPFNLPLFKGRIMNKKPKRGDIIIFRPPNDMKTRYVKRLIGLPKDKIQLLNGNLYINDKILLREISGTFTNDRGMLFNRYIETLPNQLKHYTIELSNPHYLLKSTRTTEPFYVPEGHYFFLGDNRDLSKDSRFELGFVPEENFIAKARFIFFSTEENLILENFDLLKQISQIWYWISSIRFNRLFNSVYSIR